MSAGPTILPEKRAETEREGLSTTQWASILVLVTVLAYAPALIGGFIWDDDDYVLRNYNLRTTSGLAKIWLEPRASPQYYPLVHTSFWLEYRLWGEWPGGYHATNVALHAASALLLWRLLLLLELPGAWLAAALFALHPVHVESVAWITERKNTLSLLFYLAAAFCFLKRELAGNSRGNWGLYLAALGCFLAAILSKSVTATLPCALLVILWWKQGTISLKQVALIAPMLLMAVPLGLHTAYLERDSVGAIGPEWDFSIAERCLIAGRAVWFYAGKLVWPHPLIFFYPRWEIDERDWRQYLYPVALCGFVAMLFLLRGRVGRGPLAAALLFGGTLFPALGFFNFYPMKFSFVADHFQYAASIGLILLLVCGAANMAARYGLSTAGSLLGCGLLAVLATLTWRQCLIYQDQETLWRDTLAKNPTSEIAHVNLGSWLRGEGRFPEAIEAFEGAVRLNPGDPDGHIGLAMTHSAQGNLDQAERILREAIPLGPKYAPTYGNLADVLDRQERLEESATLYQQALALDEKNVVIRYNYGNLLLKQRQLAEAQEQYEQVLARSPDSVTTRYNLAVVHWERGNWTAAAQQFRAVLAIDPDYPEAREFLREAEANARATSPREPVK